MRISDWSSDVCSSDLTAALDDTALDDREIDAILGRIQNDLFDLGADLATPEVENPKYPPLRIVAEQVERLEGEIDRLNADLAPLNSFVLPGGSPASDRKSTRLNSSH